MRLYVYFITLLRFGGKLTNSTVQPENNTLSKFNIYTHACNSTQCTQTKHVCQLVLIYICAYVHVRGMCNGSIPPRMSRPLLLIYIAISLVMRINEFN